MLEKHEIENPENWNAAPQPIEWEDFFDGCADRVIPGVEPHCPTCGELCYNLDRCAFCGQPFLEDAKSAAMKLPPNIEYGDCLNCGGKGTFEFTRFRLNGHMQGHCTVCRMSMIE